MNNLQGTAAKKTAAGNKTGYYADKVYLYGLVFFLASQACAFSGFVSVLFYNPLFYAGAALLIAAGIYRLIFAFFGNLRKAVLAIIVLLFFAFLFFYSAKTIDISDALVYLVLGFAIVGAINVKADHILIAGVIGNIVMIFHNIFMSCLRTDDISANLYTDNDFFYFGDDLFYIHKFNNSSSTDFAAHYFWIIAAYLWIRGKKITWGEIIATGALGFLVYSLSGSNTSLICISLSVLIAVISKLYTSYSMHSEKNHTKSQEKEGSAIWKTLIKTIEICSKYSFVIFALIIISLTLLYDIGSPLFYRLNMLLHQRLALGQRGIIEHGIHLFTSGVVLYGNNTTIERYYNFIDSSYVSIIVTMGIIPFVFYLVSMTAVQIKHKKYLYGAALLAVCALSCLEEHHMAEIPYNFFLLLIFADFGAEKTDNLQSAKRKKNNNGNLNIAAIVLAAVFFISAICINYPRFTAIQECNRLDQKAGEIYSAVQKNLDELSAGGKWQEQTSLMTSYQYGDVLSEPYDFPFITGRNWAEETKDPKAHSYYSVSYDASFENGSYEILDLLITDEVKSLVGSGSIVIEYDVVTGNVYSVWYTDGSGCQPVRGGRASTRLERLKVKEGMTGYSTGGANG